MAERSESTFSLRNLKKPAVALTLGLALVQGCGGESDDNRAKQSPKDTTSPSKNPETPVSSESPTASPIPLSLGERVIAETTTCESLDDNSPLYKKLKEPRAVVVDGRCDAAPDAPIGVYPEPNQERDSIDQVVTGEVLGVFCVTGGQFRQNVRGDGSIEWVKVRSKNRLGYMPAIWTHGEKGLQDC